MFTDKAQMVIGMAKDRAHTLGLKMVDVESLLAAIRQDTEAITRLAECLFDGDSELLRSRCPEYGSVQVCPVVMKPDDTLRGLLEAACELAGAAGVPDREHPGQVALPHLVCAIAMSAEAVKLLGEEKPISEKQAVEFLTGWIIEGPGKPTLSELVERVRGLRSELLGKVFGQDHAVYTFVEGLYNALVTSSSDVERKRPMGVFVFAGPPGVGKTYMAELCSAYLKRPFKRFDMTGYSDHHAYNELIGFEPSYKGAKPGVLTGFVKQNPEAILLFDEIEKANLTTMQLFYQILDAGRLQDKFNEEEVLFRDTIIIFTTNAGRTLYDNPNQSGISAANASYRKRTILSALENEKNPADGRPAFPAAICSRLGQGYAVMFNHLGINELVKIVETEIKKTELLLERQYFKPFRHDPLLPILLVLRESAGTDARQLRSEAERFIKSELFKFCSLYENQRIEDAMEDVKQIVFTVDADSLQQGAIRSLFQPDNPKILLAANAEFTARCREEIPEINWIGVETSEEAIEQLTAHEIDFVLLDLWLQPPRVSLESPALHIEGPQKLESNTISAGMDHIPLSARALDTGRSILQSIHERFPQMPVYLLSFISERPNRSDSDNIVMTLCMDAQQEIRESDGKVTPDVNRRIIGDELFLACVRAGGARGLISTGYGAGKSDVKMRESFVKSILETHIRLHREHSARNLVREHKSLEFTTVSRPNALSGELQIILRNFQLSRVLDANDAGQLLSDVERPSVRFDDVLGAAEAKKALGFIVDWLRNPKKYAGLGLHPPKGILMAGPPGTGKTLLARAVAGESDCAFCQTSATNFVTIWQGSGPQNIRDLFSRARRYAPAIVFIDEIDAIGKQRMGGGSARAQEDTLNSLLTEMDGFGAPSAQPVIVLAATNMVKMLDDALKRRFDRIIEVDKPDKQARLKYLRKTFSKRQKCSVSDSILERIAAQSAGMTIANLERIVQEAGVSAAQQGTTIDDSLLEESFERIRMGEAQKLPDKETLLRIARHEAGHTFIAWRFGNRPYQVTIVGRGGAGGYMERKPEEDRIIYTREELEQTICETMGGRAAEIVYYGEDAGLSTGVSSDLKSATQRAKQMVCNFGMDSKIGQIALEELSNRESPTPLADQVANQVTKIVSGQLEKAVKLIKAECDTFDKLVSELLDKNRLTEDELAKILD